LVVRVTNKDVISQITSADLTHDVVLASAYSHELPRYGIKLGLTNYAAAYATGLLLARRINEKLGLSYEGNTEINGEDYNVEAEEDRKPFRAFLDVGLARTTTGARIFGALKGATDGGLDIPHNDHRFPGSKRDGDKWAGDAETHRKYIFGGHVAEYMKKLQEEDEERYNKQFKRYVDNGISADDLEAIYTEAHSQIRAEPDKARGDLELGFYKTRTKAKPDKITYDHSKYKPKVKLSAAQKKNRVKQVLSNKKDE